jgi:hypothetical protein
MVKTGEYPLWPARVVEVLARGQFRIQFYGDRGVEIVRASGMTEYE